MALTQKRKKDGGKNESMRVLNFAKVVNGSVKKGEIYHEEFVSSHWHTVDPLIIILVPEDSKYANKCPQVCLS